MPGEVPERGVGLRQPRVKLQRSLSRGPRFRYQIRCRDDVVIDAQRDGVREARVRERIFRINLNGVLEMLGRLAEGVEIALVPEVSPLQVQIVRFQAGRRRLQRYPAHQLALRVCAMERAISSSTAKRLFNSRS